MTTKLFVEGMSCQHCVRHVTEALEEIAGVIGAKVDLDAQTATVEHDDAITAQALIAAVDEAGYSAHA